MADPRCPILLVVPDELLPAVSFDGRAISPGEQGATITWLAWDGSTESIAQTITCSAEFHRALGTAITAVAAGAAGSTVAAVTATDPQAVVAAATVGGRAKVTLQYQDAVTSVDVGAPIAIDNTAGSPLAGDGGPFPLRRARRLGVLSRGHDAKHPGLRNGR